MSNETIEMQVGTKVKYRKLECPFDLDTVLQISYSSQGLKSVLEFILDHVGELKALQEEGDNLFGQIKQTPIRPKSCTHYRQWCTCDHQEGVGMRDFTNLKDRVDDLEEKSEVLDSRLKDHAANNEQEHLNMVMASEKNSKNIEYINDPQLANIWDLLKSLQNQVGKLENDVGNLNAKEPVTQVVQAAAETKVVEKTIVKEVAATTKGVDFNELDGRYAGKNKPDLTIVRIEELENQMKEMAEKWEQSKSLDLSGRVTKLETFKAASEERHTTCELEIEELKKKVAILCEPRPKSGTKIEAGDLLMMINALKQEMTTKCTRQDLDQLKFQLQKYADNGDLENKKHFDDLCADLKHMIEQLRAEFENHVSVDFMSIVQRVTVLEKRLSQLSAEFGKKGPTTNVTGFANNDELKRLAELLALLQTDVNNLKTEIQNGFADLAAALDLKADRVELKDLEARFMDQINDLVKVMSKKFADKAQNKKEHQDMERQIRNLYDIMMSKGGQNNEEDAMFTKKPFAGLSCASCEKDIINMYGKRVEFMPWGKMPFRDPSERISRVGQGFSKMLSMLKPDSLSRYDASRISPDVHGSSGNLPPMEKKTMYVPEEHRKTHSRFPNPHSRMVVNSEQKRPGSAQARHAMAARNSNGKQQ